VRNLVLFKPMMQRIQQTIGYRIGVHFNLSGFTSTDRGWHQDDYMYARTVMASGVAAWIALDDVTTDMGPFEFVPGSHKWAWMRKWLVTPHLKQEVLDNPEGKWEFGPTMPKNM
jgi:ectoine hydroxylase-related dioxygenase (phytanoyl-CoA dioxygenase family)